MINLYKQKEILKIEKAANIAAGVLSHIESYIVPGISTSEINKEIDARIRSFNAYPAFLGYSGFPAASCISINEEVVHGVPGKQKSIKNGDIVSIDVGSCLDGFYGDTARTFVVGEIKPETKLLVKTTLESLNNGIKAVVTGNHISDISKAVENTVLAKGFSVVKDLVGHGIGRDLHEEPQIPNYFNGFKGDAINEGMVFAIEPMINLGTWKVKTRKDGWTVITKDKKPSAHFEHMVAVVNGKAEILTAWS